MRGRKNWEMGRGSCYRHVLGGLAGYLAQAFARYERVSADPASEKGGRFHHGRSEHDGCRVFSRQLFDSHLNIGERDYPETEGTAPGRDSEGKVLDLALRFLGGIGICVKVDTFERSSPLGHHVAGYRRVYPAREQEKPLPAAA